MKGTNRTNVAAYLVEQRHLRGNLRGAKTLTQMAAELCTTKSTVRRWLRRDHWELWMENWASVDELWVAATQEPARQREAMQPVEKGHPKMLVLDLDRCLAELTNEVSIME
jgi:hypothetical protein